MSSQVGSILLISCLFDEGLRHSKDAVRGDDMREGPGGFFFFFKKVEQPQASGQSAVNSSLSLSEFRKTACVPERILKRKAAFQGL